MHKQEIFSDTIEYAIRVRDMLNRNPDPEWRAGSAEPWIARLLAQLVLAHGARDVVEIGGFDGYTSERLFRALSASGIPGATLTVCEIDPERATRISDRLRHIMVDEGINNVVGGVVVADSLEWLRTTPNESFDFVWLDGCHEKEHVDKEITLLLPKLRVDGVVYGHDVFGTCDLHTVFEKHGGYALDLPKLGLAGGIGILQRRA